jgi:hypothetical protein
MDSTLSIPAAVIEIAKSHRHQGAMALTDPNLAWCC